MVYIIVITYQKCEKIEIAIFGKQDDLLADPCKSLLGQISQNLPGQIAHYDVDRR